MKKNIGFVAIASFVFSLSFAVLANAQGGDTNTSRPGFNETQKTRVENFKNEMDAKREAFKNDANASREAFIEQMRASRQTFISSLKADRDAFIAELKAKKEAFRNTNEEKKEEFRQNAKRMIGNRFEAAVTNLERVQGRISDLIDKLNAEGKDTGTAEDSLDISKQKLADAKVKIAAIKALIPEDGEKVTPEVFEQIKTLARDAKNLLKESHYNLIEAIKTLRSLNSENGDEDEENNE